MSVTNEDKATRAVELMLFKTNTFNCAVDIQRLQEIGQLVKVTPVHKSPPYVNGVINLRGQIVTVIDLSKRFNLEVPEYDDESRIIFINYNNHLYGLIISQIEDISPTTEQSFEPLPSNFDPNMMKFFEQVYKTEKNIYSVVNIDAVLNFESDSENEQQNNFENN